MKRKLLTSSLTVALTVVGVSGAATAPSDPASLPGSAVVDPAAPLSPSVRVGENKNSQIEGNASGGGGIYIGPKFLSEQDKQTFIGWVNDQYARGLVDQAAALALLSDSGLTADLLKERPATAKAIVQPLAAAARTLTITHRPQENSYYCGPAVAQMVLQAYPTSKFDGRSRIQGVLAQGTYLDTTAANGTRYGSGSMVRTLEKWMYGKFPSSWKSASKPSAATFQAALRSSIGDRGTSAAVSTVELAGGAHYNGHPNRTIGHWIAAYGYSSNGAVGSFAVPATSIWTGVSARFNYSTGIFRDNWLANGNGVVYL